MIYKGEYSMAITVKSEPGIEDADMAKNALDFFGKLIIFLVEERDKYTPYPSFNMEGIKIQLVAVTDIKPDKNSWKKCDRCGCQYNYSLNNCPDCGDKNHIIIDSAGNPL